MRRFDFLIELRGKAESMGRTRGSNDTGFIDLVFKELKLPSEEMTFERSRRVILSRKNKRRTTK